MKLNHWNQAQNKFILIATVNLIENQTFCKGLWNIILQNVIRSYLVKTRRMLHFNMVHSNPVQSLRILPFEKNSTLPQIRWGNVINTMTCHTFDFTAVKSQFYGKSSEYSTIYNHQNINAVLGPRLRIMTYAPFSKGWN